MSRPLVIPTTVWGDTASPFECTYTLLTGALATITAATVSVYDADTGTLVVNASDANVATPTIPVWPQTWGSVAETGPNTGQIPLPTASKRYLVQPKITVGGLTKTLPLMEWTVDPPGPI